METDVGTHSPNYCWAILVLVSKNQTIIRSDIGSSFKIGTGFETCLGLGFKTRSKTKPNFATEPRSNFRPLFDG